MSGGFVETLRRLSGRSSMDKSNDDMNPSSPRTNVWSSTFDPGRNANLQRKSGVGGSYYDKPTAGDTKTVWDCHLESQKSGGADAAAPAAVQAASNVVDAAELKRMMSAERVEAAMRQAGSGGKVDFNKFMDELRKGT